MSLLQPLGPGETLELNADVWNQLLKALSRAGAPGPFRLSASSNYVEVHYDAAAGYPLSPERIVIKDVTDWHGVETDQVRVTYRLEGIGELSRTQARAGEAVEWTWGYGRSWGATVGGRPLPTATTVIATAEILADDGVTWLPYGEARHAIVVARALNPNLFEGLSLQLLPEADQFSLSEAGGARLKVYDFSTFPDEVLSVRRTLSLFWLRADGTTAAPGAELKISNAAVANLKTTDAARTAELDVAAPGEVVIRAEYELTYAHGAEVRTLERRLRALPPVMRVIPTNMPPTLPTFRVTPQNGRTRIALALPVVLHGYTATSEPRDIFNTIEPAQTLAGAMTHRLKSDPISIFTKRAGQATGSVLNNPVTQRTVPVSVPAGGFGDQATITVPQAQQLLNAATVIRNALTTYTGGIVRTYSVRLAPGVGAAVEDLLALVPGQVLYVPSLGAALRVLRPATATQITASGATIAGVTIDAEGLLEYERHDLAAAFQPAEGWASGAADLLVVRATFAYGTIDEPTFAQNDRTFISERLFDPRATLPVFDQLLPVMQPAALSDGWYVRVQVASAFRGLAYEVAELPFTQAEIVPGGAPELTEGSFRGAARYFDSPLKADANYDFFGYTTWVQDDKVGTDDPAVKPDAARVLRQRLPLREGEPLPVPASATDRPVRLYVHGHFRAKGGSGQREIKTVYTRTAVTVDGAPIIVRDDIPESGPTFEAPIGGGIFLIDRPTGRVWMSVLGSWTLVNPGLKQTPYGYGDPTAAAGDYNFAPTIRGEDATIVMGKVYSETDGPAYEAEDPYGTVEVFSLSGVPDFFEQRHFYRASAEEAWRPGAAAARQRKIVLVGTPTRAVEYQVRASASDGAKATAAEFLLSTLSGDTTGPVIQSAFFRGTDPTGTVRDMTVVRTATSVTAKAEVGSTGLYLEVRFADRSGIETLTLDLPQSAWTFSGDKLTITNLSCTNQLLSGSVLDKAGNRTSFTVSLETFTADRTPPSLKSITITPADKIQPVSTDTSSRTINAYAGASLTAVFEFEDASGIGLLRKTSGIGSTGTQDGAKLTVRDILVPTSIGQMSEIKVEAQDAKGNAATFTLKVLTVAVPVTDTTPPAVFGVKLLNQSAVERQVSWDAVSATAAFAAGDTKLSYKVYVRDASGVTRGEVLSGPPAVTRLESTSATDFVFTVETTDVSAKTFGLRFTDGVGNTKEYSIALTAPAPEDTTAPTVSLTAAEARKKTDAQYEAAVVNTLSGESYELRYDSSKHDQLRMDVVFTDGMGTGVKQARLKAAGTLSEQWNGTTRKLQVWNIAAGAPAFDIEVEDFAGNKRTITVSTQDTFQAPADTAAPVLTAVAATGADGAALTAQRLSATGGKVTFRCGDLGGKLTAALTFSDDSGLGAVSISGDPGAAVSKNGAVVTVSNLTAQGGYVVLSVADTNGKSADVTLTLNAVDTVAPQITRAMSATWKGDGTTQLVEGEAADAGGLRRFQLLPTPALPAFVTSTVYKVWAVDEWVEDANQSTVGSKRTIKLSGAPTAQQAGTYALKAEAEDACGNKTVHDFTITVEASGPADPSAPEVSVDYTDWNNNYMDQPMRRVEGEAYVGAPTANASNGMMLWVDYRDLESGIKSLQIIRNDWPSAYRNPNGSNGSWSRWTMFNIPKSQPGTVVLEVTNNAGVKTRVSFTQLPTGTDVTACQNEAQAQATIAGGGADYVLLGVDDAPGGSWLTPATLLGRSVAFTGLTAFPGAGESDPARPQTGAEYPVAKAEKVTVGGAERLKLTLATLGATWDPNYLSYQGAYANVTIRYCGPVVID